MLPPLGADGGFLTLDITGNAQELRVGKRRGRREVLGYVRREDGDTTAGARLNFRF